MYGFFSDFSERIAIPLNVQTQLAAVFVVFEGKIISECRKENQLDRFDKARVIIDPEYFFSKNFLLLLQLEWIDLFWFVI